MKFYYLIPAAILSASFEWYRNGLMLWQFHLWFIALYVGFNYLGLRLVGRLVKEFINA